MPPFRYFAVVLPLVLLFWLIFHWTPEQSFVPALAQVETNLSTSNTQAVNSAEIELSIITNSPKRIGETVTFTAVVYSGDTGNLTFYWDFGDNEAGQGRVVSHIYTRGGTFKPYVIVSDGTHSTQVETTVIITDTPTPIVQPTPISGLTATSNAPTTAGNPTRFLATPLQGSDIIYEWDFGDGSSFRGGNSPSHIYTIPKTYFVTVSAINSVSRATFTFPVVITEAPPRGLKIIAQTEATVNTTIPFTATIEGGTNVQFEWVFSDGLTWLDPNRGPVLNKSTYNRPFDTPKLHTVSVYVSNSVGRISASINLLIRDTPPMIISVLDDTNGVQRDIFNFTAFVRSNSTVDGQWFWGDSTVSAVNKPVRQDGSPIKEFQATHQFQGEDKFIVSFVASNSGGTVATDTIINTGPGGSFGTPIEITYSPQLRVGKVITFSVGLDRQQYDCAWDFGDGTNQPRGTVSIQHTYQKAKGYIVNVYCFPTKAGQQTTYYRDQIVYVGNEIFMPLLFDPHATPTSVATGNPGGAPTTESTPTDVPTLAATATAVPTLTPTFTAVVTPTEIPTEAATEMPTEVPTATQDVGGTVPQVTPTPTEDPGNGTVPQVTPTP